MADAQSSARACVTCATPFMLNVRSAECHRCKRRKTFESQLKRQLAAPGHYSRTGKGRRRLICWLEKTCRKCGALKSLSLFPVAGVGGSHDGRGSTCRECRGIGPQRTKRTAEEKHQFNILRNRAARRKKAAADGRVLGVRRLAPEDVAKRIARNEARQEELIVRNARDAWNYWLRTRAPAWWIREHYRDRPWSNPRLTDSEAYRIRYWIDDMFRAKEILRIQRAKECRAKYIDANNDGTLTPETLCALFAAARECTYCKKVMRSVEKTLDHIVPISRGGQHALSNVCVCCKECNTLKSDRTIDEWIGHMLRKLLIINKRYSRRVSHTEGAASAGFDSFSAP
jgi:5-methylcytosine-specific restriction endonuclease McrA